VDSSSGRQSRNSTGGCGQLEAVRSEAVTTPSALFSYPPPASRPPLPPTEPENQVFKNGIQELSVKGLSEDLNEDAGESGGKVPHYPLKVSNSEPVRLSAASEEQRREGGDQAPCDDNYVFEDTPPIKCSTPPVPAPRKGMSFRKGISTPDQAGPDAGATAKECKRHMADSSNGNTKNNGSEYENVRHGIERMKSAPAISASPVYAEPVVSNQRTRIMTYNPGVSKTPPLSGSRKLVGTSRQRSVSGGDSSPLVKAHILKNTRPAESGSQGLDKIVEKEESFQEVKALVLPVQPEDYMEPVVIKKKKKK